MYKIKNTSAEYLIDNGFKEVGDGVYRLRFPIYFYKKKTPLLFCNALVIPNNGKRVNIDVENANGRTYAAWYNTEYDQLAPKFRKELVDNISKKMHKIGARHYEDR